MTNIEFEFLNPKA